MKKVFVLLHILSGFSSYARDNDSTVYRYRVQISYVYAMPQGQFSSKSSNPFITGQCEASPGICALLEMKLYKRCNISLQFTDVKYKVNPNALYTAQKQRYNKQGYFTTVTGNMPYLDVAAISGEVSYSLQYHSVEIEPWFSLGVGFVNFSNNNTAKVHRKQKDNNYYEDIYQYLDHSNVIMLSPGMGVRVNKRIYGMLYGSLSLGYNYGILNYTIRDEKTDLLNHIGKTTQSIDQPVSTLQVQAGIQFRFHKWLNWN